MSNISFAQNFEDAMLWRALSGVENGFYIDIGAADPHEDSVTKFFYLNGWHGVNVEPRKEKEQSFKTDRPLDVNISCAVSDISGIAELVVDGGLSYLQKVGAASIDNLKHKTETVNLMTLSDICEKYVPDGQEIHFLKIDVEGSEKDVIQGANWQKWKPWIVVVEATKPQTQEPNHFDWEPTLLDAGYVFAWFDGLNRFYLLDEKYDDLSPYFQIPINIFDDFVRVREVFQQRRLDATSEKIDALQKKLSQYEKELLLDMEALKFVPSVPGLTVFSCLRCSNGVGQSARIISNALHDNNIPISNRVLKDHRDTVDWKVPHYNPVRKSTLVSWDILGLGSLVRLLNRTQFNIVYPWWELELIPEHTIGSLSYFDELWAPSRFIADNFARVFKHEVEYVPQPLTVPDQITRPSMNGAFRVFTFFDTDSWQARKNPFASVKAFQAAFPPARTDVQLVVKLRGDFDQGARRWLQEEAAKDARIVVVDAILSRKAMEDLTSSCHVFISLHRSEGLGLGAAEALAAGRPVVATDYSGTKDFVTPQTGYPVSYEMVALKEGDYPNWINQKWADPDIDHAASHLRSLYDDYETGLARAEKGHELLRQNHSAEAFAKKVKYLLERRGLL